MSFLGFGLDLFHDERLDVFVEMGGNPHRFRFTAEYAGSLRTSGIIDALFNSFWTPYIDIEDV